ncbi:MAG: C4-dicarboxylate TRAP transporter substrate-binding protein [Sagittula sp.]|uniref:C4-dicarboxylate TRAP transporter substrate-binding protein n=1 Tax=Sagittula sp. TaxID=2038081 RepID=UPI004059F4E4
MKTRLTLAALALAIAPVAAGAQTVLRYADYGGNRGIRAEFVTKFLDEVEARSEGRIKIERHWAQALLPAKEILDGIKNGVTSLGTVTAGYTPEDMFVYRVGDLPISNPNEIAGSLALYELATTHEAMQQEFDEQGVVYLLNYSVGPIQMVCSGEPMEHVEDFAGRKVRATADYGEIYGKFGAIHVPLSLPQAYQALDTGLIDCSQAYGYVIESYKLHEVADSLTVIDGATIQSNAMFMSRRDFDAMDPKDQEMIIALGKQYTEDLAKAMRARNQEVIAQLGGEGFDGKVLKVATFTDEDRAKLDEAGQSFIDDYIAEGEKRGLDARALVEDYKALLAKYLAEVAG